MPNKLVKLPDAELEIMKVIWKNECPISTAHIKSCLDMLRPWNLSALQTLLNRLIARNFLISEKQGKNRYYEPVISEEKYLALENKSYLEKLNNNSIKKFVASLYDSNAITEHDLIDLKQFIEEKTKGEPKC